MRDENMSQKPLTDLQQAIKAIVDENPGWDDDQVAKAAFSKLNPGQEWPKKNPTATYVQKMRRRFIKKSAPTNVEVEVPPEFFEDPETEAEEAEEPFDPMKALEEEMDKEAETAQQPAPGFDTSVDFSDDDLNTIIGLPFSKLARYTGYDGWRLDPADPDDRKFIQLSNKMAHKYVPDLLARYGLEIMWSVSCLGFFGSRIAGHRKYKAEHGTVIEKQLEKEKKPQEPAPESVILPAETQPEKPKEPKPGELAAGQDEFLRRQKA